MDDPESSAYPGGLFPRAQHFVISGGVFTSHATNNVFNTAQQPAPVFRTIALGDIDLLNEIRVDDSGVVDRWTRRASLRRIYCARIEGHRSQHMTVAVYQGNGAAEQWRRAISQYELIRHPNILQLYGVTSTRGIRAMIFHDDLIPYRQFLTRFRHSFILLRYIIGCFSQDYCDGYRYLRSFLPAKLRDYYYCGFWIRRSTGQLCADLTLNPGRELEFPPIYPGNNIARLDRVSLDDSNMENMVVSSLTVDDFLDLYLLSYVAQYLPLMISTRATISPGSIIFCSSLQRATFLEIAISPDLYLNVNKWDHAWHWAEPGINHGKITEESWIRFHSWDEKSFAVVLDTNRFDGRKFWVAQAEHVFNLLQATSDFENYVLVEKIEFRLTIFRNTVNPHRPEGYLFVCPARDFQAGSSSFRWPDCPAFWSLDPSGADRLSPEDAKILGFPTIHAETVIHGVCWDDVVYTGLRRFQRAKGFNQDAQDLAKDLGYPLYELSNQLDGPFAYAKNWWVESVCQTCYELGHYL